MASADIFRAYLQPAKSVQDYADQYDMADMRRQSLADGAFDLQQKQQAAQQAAQQRNALVAAFQAQQDPVKLEDALIRNPLTLAQGQDMRKARTAAEEAAAKAGNYTSETKARDNKDQREAADAERAKRVRAIQDIASFKGPQDAIDSVVRHAKAGEIDNATAQRMVQQFQSMTTPEHWSSWQDQPLTSMMTADQVKTHQRQLTNDAAANANRPLIADPARPGQFVANVPLQQYEKDKAKAGAASTVVNMADGQKGFDNEIKLRNDFKAEPIYKAHQEMQSAYGQIGQALKQASPSGDLAAATKIMKLLDPGSVVRESELGMAMAATGMLDRITSYAGNVLNGTKLTPQQRVQFQQLADALMSTSVEQFNVKHGEYLKLGSDYGLNAARALGATAKPVGPAAKKLAGGSDGAKATPSAAVPDDIQALLIKHGGK